VRRNPYFPRAALVVQRVFPPICATDRIRLQLMRYVHFFHLFIRVAMMAAKCYPIGSAEGLAEARRRIAKARRTGAEELDIGGLSLVEVPAELFELLQLKVLYLGLPKAAAEKPGFERTYEDKKSCNAVRALPSAFFTSLHCLACINCTLNITR
jgi:hypothetical protein